MNLERLTSILQKIPSARIAVVGDFFLDRYWEIAPELDEPSVETGLTAYQVAGRRASAGAAGTVTNNLAALGVGGIYAVGFAGEDGEGYELRRCLDAVGVRREFLFETAERVTPCYTKPMREGVEMNRFDIKNRTPTPASLEDRIISAVETVAQRVDAVMVMDQVSEPDCGTVTRRVRECLTRLGRAGGKTIFYADSRERIGEFREMLIKCNAREAAETFSMYDGTAPSASTLQTCGFRLAERTGRPVFITLGEDGQMIFNPGCRESIHVPAIPVTGEIDICGAGDATSSALVAALCAGATHEEAAILGNLASSVTIRKLGQTGTATPEEIREAWRHR